MKDDFSPLISIEKFAAYLDGNLSEDELRYITSLMESDEDMRLLCKMNDGIDYDNDLLSNEIEMIDVSLDVCGFNEKAEVDMFADFFSNNEMAVHVHTEDDGLTNDVLGQGYSSVDDMNILESADFMEADMDDFDGIL